MGCASTLLMIKTAKRIGVACIYSDVRIHGISDPITHTHSCVRIYIHRHTLSSYYTVLVWSTLERYVILLLLIYIILEHCIDGIIIMLFGELTISAVLLLLEEFAAFTK
jgi:hypothetical protein